MSFEDEELVAAEPDAPVPAEERIFAMCLPLVEEHDAELIDVEHVGNTLRFYVDAQPDGVTTAQLTKINRSVSVLLDETDPIAGRYTLEVSSPGLERRLNRLAHYERAVGENVIVKLLRHLDTRRVRGELKAATEEEIVVSAVEVDGIDLGEPEEMTIPMEEIDKTRTVFEWGPKGKPGHPNKKKGRK